MGNISEMTDEGLETVAKTVEEQIKDLQETLAQVIEEIDLRNAANIEAEPVSNFVLLDVQTSSGDRKSVVGSRDADKNWAWNTDLNYGKWSDVIEFARLAKIRILSLTELAPVDKPQEEV